MKWSARSTGQCTSNLKSVNSYSTTRFHLGLIQIRLCGMLYTSEKRPHIHVINDDMFGCSYEPPNTNLAQMPDGWASTRCCTARIEERCEELLPNLYNYSAFLRVRDTTGTHALAHSGQRMVGATISRHQTRPMTIHVSIARSIAKAYE